MFTRVVTTALAVLSLSSILLVVSEEEVSANLLVSKVILNKYLVQDKDLTVEYNIYNVGDGCVRFNVVVML